MPAPSALVRLEPQRILQSWFTVSIITNSGKLYLFMFPAQTLPVPVFLSLSLVLASVCCFLQPLPLIEREGPEWKRRKQRKIVPRLSSCFPNFIPLNFAYNLTQDSQNEKKKKKQLKLCSLQQQILLVEKYVSMLDGNIWTPSHLMVSKPKIPPPQNIFCRETGEEDGF